MRRFLLAGCVAVLCSGNFLWAQTPAEDKIHTTRQSAQTLVLPKDDDSFHFIIFGDRTSGRPEGIPVLEQAVKDANLLSPDLVMTIGDLIQGYNTQKPWEEEMREYKSVMSHLRMPWFPVAGNHDVYWDGDDQPLHEHEANYEKHFGPLWYWFEHKNCGFLILFSDEGDLSNPEKEKDFADPAQHRFSEEQMTWIRESLQKMKDLRHVFVFQHHPRWNVEKYSGSNWEEVHKMMVENGNVRACFAGHIHQLRHFGIRDGIEYSTLATTGGNLRGNGDYPEAGLLHHFNVVTVRKDDYHVAVVPVGQTRDAKQFTSERLEDMNLVNVTTATYISSSVTLDAKGNGGGSFKFEWENIGKKPIEVKFFPDPNNYQWTYTPPTQQVRFEPGEKKVFEVKVARDQTHLSKDVKAPELHAAVQYLDDSGAVKLPVKRFAIFWSYSDLPEGALAPAKDSSALLIPADWCAVRVDASRMKKLENSFTVEAWVYPNYNTDSAGIVSKAQNSEFGLLTKNNNPVLSAHLDGKQHNLNAPEALPLKKWSHVAGVYDGQHLVLYVNGAEVARKAAQGSVTPNDLPLYVGADPDARSHPKQIFYGWIDEVRISKTARYTGGFTPVKEHQSDADTLLYFPFHRAVSNIIPDHSDAKAHGQLFGGARLETAPK